MNVTALIFDVSQLTDTPNAAKDRHQPKLATVSAADLTASQSGAPAAATPVRERPIINGLGLELQFSTDEQTGQSVIRVRDADSGQVVRQIPSEQVLNFLRQLDEKKGLFLSRRL